MYLSNLVNLHLVWISLWIACISILCISCVEGNQRNHEITRTINLETFDESKIFQTRAVLNDVETPKLSNSDNSTSTDEPAEIEGEIPDARKRSKIKTKPKPIPKPKPKPKPLSVQVYSSQEDLEHEYMSHPDHPHDHPGSSNKGHPPARAHKTTHPPIVCGADGVDEYGNVVPECQDQKVDD